MVSTDEEFTEIIRGFPILYNKNEKGYRDINVVRNAWKKVVENCGENVAELNEENVGELVVEAQKRFINIKKRFNSKRKKAKGPSGSGVADLEDASRKFQDMIAVSLVKSD